MRNFCQTTLSVTFVFLLAAGLAAGQGGAKPAEKKAAEQPAAEGGVILPTEDTVEAFLKAQFGYQPDLNWKIASIKPAGTAGLAEVVVIMATPQGQQAFRFYATPDGQHAIVGDIIPFGAKPFEPVKKLLTKGISGPERGPKDSAVTIVEFGDLQCPACKAAQPTIEQLVAAEPTAHFVFQNFPLEMHNWANKGAAYADCVGRASNDAFWKFMAKTYETQSDITAENADEKLTALANGAGVKGSEIAACAVTPETKAHIDASLALGKSVGVTGTPTLYVNGRQIGNFNKDLLDVYKALVEFAGKGGN
jgi:protein-disulfide isomerase